MELQVRHCTDEETKALRSNLLWVTQLEAGALRSWPASQEAKTGLEPSSTAWTYPLPSSGGLILFFPPAFPKLQETVEQEIRDMGLQSTPFTLTKVFQLYETKNSRHSTMIVGCTGSGKTASWRILQASLSSLCRAGDPNFNIVRVRRERRGRGSGGQRGGSRLSHRGLGEMRVGKERDARIPMGRWG